MIKSDAAAQVVQIRADENEGLLSFTLDPAEFADHWEWHCYTKPIGPGVRIVVMQGSHRGFQVTSTGTLVESSEQLREMEGSRATDAFPCDLTV